jgi:hypothetical protein
MITSEQAAPEVQRAIDAEDVFHISSLLSPDNCLHLGNDEPVHGLAGVSARIAGLLAAVSTLSHELCETWVHADTVMYEVQIIHRHPAVRRHFWLNSGLIPDDRADMDINPLCLMARSN